MNRCVDDNSAKRETDVAMIAFVARKVQASRLIIEMRDPKALAFVTLVEAAGKKRACGFETIELQRKFGTLIPHGIAVAAGAVTNDANRVGIGRKESPLWRNMRPAAP